MRGVEAIHQAICEGSDAGSWNLSLLNKCKGTRVRPGGGRDTRGEEDGEKRDEKGSKHEKVTSGGVGV